MIGRRLLLAAAFSTVSLFSTEASAQRHALVIGNSAYGAVAPLRSPQANAADMAAALGRLGFQVMNVRDADAATMRRALVDFAARATGAEMAIIYYSGHGIEVDGSTYLLPVDAKPSAEFDVDGAALDIEKSTDPVIRSTKFGLVIVDAGWVALPRLKRPPPSAKPAPAAGLASPAPAGSFILAFAARKGGIALDGAGARNSPYTASLLTHIETPHLDVYRLFRRVGADVVKATQGRQEPFFYGSLPSDPIFLRQPSL